MTLIYDHYRVDWQAAAEPISGPAFYWDKIDTIVIHYPGADWSSMDFDKNGVADWRDTRELLRRQQHDYLTSRGYSLGYNAAVDVWGHTWEIRGDTFRCAANSGWNERSYAIQLIVDEENPATPEQAAACRRLVRQIIAKRPNVQMLPHSTTAVGGTNTRCPGRGISEQLRLGAFWPDYEPPKPPPIPGPSPSVEVVDMIVLDYKPNTPGWIRFTWDGIRTVAHIKSGNTAQILNKAGVKAVTVDRAELLALLREPATETLGPSPFTGSVYGDQDLHAAWSA